MQTAKAIIATILSGFLFVGAAEAQALKNAGGPAGLPPADFAGAQYADSRGCVYVRAGFDGNVVWIPRVTRDRKQLCGMTPTFARAGAAKPNRTAATVVGAVPPRASKPLLLWPRAARKATLAAAAPVATPIPIKPATLVPRGFKEAWSDGRLNPKRGPRTAAGKAQMDLVWTETVPRRLRVDEPTVRLLQTATTRAASDTILSTRTTAPQPAGARYVQVGAFGVDANARASLARLRALGMPVTTRALNRSGKSLTLVMAGPFAAGSELSRALGVARAAGFADAFLR